MTEAAARLNELILLPPLEAQLGPRGGLVLTRKYMAGAAEYARTWPGPVTTLARLSDTPTTDMDHAEFIPGEAETGLELRPSTPEALAERLRTAAAVVALLSRAEAKTARLCHEMGVPLILVSEYSPLTERQILHAEVASPFLRLRRRLWLWRTERIRRATLPLAAGLQCSGTPTLETYQRLSSDTLLFFDNRVRTDEVLPDAALATKVEELKHGRPLRLVFGGRLVAMKGVLELPRVAAELARAGVPFQLDIFGSGPLENEIAQRIHAAGLQDRVALRGVLDFEKGWIPWLRKNADLFVCCHPQGDPSSTYPEVMSCGVPIAGYANEAFSGVVRESRAGWIVPPRDATALARVIARLAADRDALATAAVRARDFARQHAFETTFARRTAHFIRHSRLPDELKKTAMSSPPSGHS